MLTVYKYDPKTRRPIGAHECRIDPNSEEPMRPRYSLDAPPPTHPDFVEVLAGNGVWWVDVDRSRMNALGEVDRIHAGLLRKLTGNATVEERDTWAPKAQAARSLLSDTADEAQTAMLEREAVQRAVSAEALAQTILGRAAAFEQLIGVASAVRAKSRAVLKDVESLDAMIAIWGALDVEVAAAVAQITAGRGDG